MKKLSMLMTPLLALGLMADVAAGAQVITCRS